MAAAPPDLHAPAARLKPALDVALDRILRRPRRVDSGRKLGGRPTLNNRRSIARIIANPAIGPLPANDAPRASKCSGSLTHGLLPRTWVENLVCDLPIGHTGSRLQCEDNLLPHAVGALKLENVSSVAQDQVLFSCFLTAFAGFAFVLPTPSPDKKSLTGLSHPPQAARLHVLMQHAIMWCTHNRPSLAMWMTIQRFQMLMGTIANTLWGFGI